MKYDFTTFIDRRGMDSIAIDGLGNGFAPDKPQAGFDVIPMWVADMSFPTVPTVTEVMINRVNHPIFGYFSPSEAYFESIIRWQRERNGINGLEKEHIGYENGVLGGLVSAVTTFASPGDAVLLHSPTYIGFTGSLKNNGYRIVHSPLRQDGSGKWKMDYEDMDKKIKENKIHVAVLCSPHNPCGRVWKKEELKQALDIYQKNDVIVISDEIWSDILLFGNKHVPTQSVNEWARENVIALYAPSKTFNLAGLIGSYHIVYNKGLHDRLRAKSSKTYYNNINVLSMHALIGAYQKEGYVWVDELCSVLSKNVDYAVRYIHERFDGVKLFRPEGTYMLFIDCTKWCSDHHKSIRELEKQGWNVGVAWQDGEMFFGKNSIRMNLALPFAKVQEAFDRLDKYVFNGKW